jgi:transcriptional regulator with XRE-family HTH domain
MLTVGGTESRALRHRAGPSGAIATGPYVSLIERGKNGPSITTLWRLATALDVTPAGARTFSRVEARHVSAVSATSHTRPRRAAWLAPPKVS